MDWTPIAVAATTGVFGVAAVSVPVLLSNRKTQAAVRDVHDEVRTNHGKPAHEYLELIAEIKEGQDALFGLLADHTQQDEAQFQALDERLKEFAA